VSVLLSKALLQYTREWESVDVALPRPLSLLFWSNFLRPVGSGVRLRDVHRVARVSRRAIRPTLQQAQLFLVTPGSGGRGEQEVCLTEHGRTALNAGAARFEMVDTAWRARFGANAVELLRRALEAFVGDLPLELPHYPIGYGPADERITGGSSVPAKAGPSPIPAHGQDWPVVRRDGMASMSDMPLSALLSQTLVAFSIDYETRSQAWRTGNSMSVAAMLGLLVPDGAPADLIPKTRAWTQGLEASGFVTVERDAMRPTKKRVALTAEGARLQAENTARLDEVERDWRDRYGAERLDALRAALEGIVHGIGVGLPDHLLVIFAPGTGFTIAPSR
jgi:hypothetical protein